MPGFLRGLRGRISYANVTATLALFVALGAGAYAAGLAPNSVKSKHIKNNQVKGADVKERSLGTVPEALIARHGGWGRQSGGPDQGGSCNPESESFVICEILNVSTKAPGRALVTGRIRAGLQQGDFASGRCRLGSSTFNPIPGSTVKPTVTASKTAEWITVVGITPPLPAGDHAFGIDCDEGSGKIEYDSARVTAVMLSPD